MKILLRCQVHDIIELEHMKEYDDPADWPTLGKAHYLEYIFDAFRDYGKHHAGKYVPIYAEVEEHDELCMWCNLHAAILDAIKGINDYDTCHAFSSGCGCEKCLENSIWYKKL